MQCNGNKSDEASILRFLACLPKVTELLRVITGKHAVALVLMCLPTL